MVAIAAAAILVIGVRYGTFAASDTDPFGYVSEAELIAAGRWFIDQRDVLTLPWRDAELSFIPDGYKRGTTPGTIVPVYPLGLPAAMAAALRVSGARDAVYYVVPLFGVAAVWLTARLGALVQTRELGAVAAVLFATSPTFLYQLVQPVSDIPAATWWLLALVLAMRGGKWRALSAGLAVSCAIVTRPNLAPQALVIALWLAWPALRAERQQRREALLPALLFVGAIVPGCIAIAIANLILYGSPLQSGYAPLHELYRLQHVIPNLQRYPRWLVEMHTPLILIGLAAPVVCRGNAVISALWAFAVMLFVSYLFFGYFEAWVYLRLLLPGLPVLLVLGLVVGAHLLHGLPLPRKSIRVLSVALVTAVAAWQSWKANSADAFRLHAIEQRYVQVGRYIAAALPKNAVYIAGLHSGSIRYYSGERTINYNTLHPRALQDAVAALTGMGRPVYFVVEEGEEPQFRWRFDTYTELGKLDWPPAHRTEEHIKVRIYDPADRARFSAGQPIVTYDMRPGVAPTVTERRADPVR